MVSYPERPRVISSLIPLLVASLGDVARAEPPCQPEACLEQAVAKLTTEQGKPSPTVRKAVIKPLTTACDAGLGQACYLLGAILREGVGVTADPARAREMLAKACDKDDGTACRTLGYMLAQGEGGPVDVPASIEPFRDACQIAYRPSPGTRSDPKQADLVCGELETALRGLDPTVPAHLAAAPALRKLSKATKLGHMPALARSALRMNAARIACAAGGDHEACLDLADEIDSDAESARIWGLPRRWPELGERLMIDLRKAACEAGVARGCRRWGDAVAALHVSDGNHAEGALLYERACLADDEVACAGLAAWHLDCDPARPVVGGAATCDPDAAAKAWKARCAGGLKAACGAADRLALGVASRARLPALTQACAAGDVMACGEGAYAAPAGRVRVDLLEKACALDSVSCHGLARVLTYGEGVPADKARGAELTRRLCNPGGGDSCMMLCAAHPGACPPPKR
ncbi:MAG: sel1 repeat family protein [Deltaproteobacteria bacterium]|nr:sel1 repeat family protein [Deltaproteobacteria bacterium]